MKPDQKWNIAAQVGLGLIIALAILTTWVLMTWIVPKAKDSHRKTLEAIPSRIADEDMAKEAIQQYSQHMIGFEMAVNVNEIVERYWILWTPLFVGALGWFEWRCTSDNKPLIRTFILMVLSLVSSAFVFWLALATAIVLTVSLG